VYQQFLQQFTQRAKSLKVGNGLNNETQMGPIVNRKQKESILNWIEIGKKEGANLLCGGSALEDGPYAKGHFIAPTIFADVTPQMRIAQEEIFGPVVSVIPCGSFEEAMEIGNGVRYGLSSSLYTQDVNRAFVAMRETHACSS
jgi:aldehyde dehydrogenase (NAD+)